MNNQTQQQMESLSDQLNLKGDQRLNEEEFWYLMLLLQAHRQHQMIFGNGRVKTQNRA